MSKFRYWILQYLINITKLSKNQSVKANYLLTTRATLTTKDYLSKRAFSVMPEHACSKLIDSLVPFIQVYLHPKIKSNTLIHHEILKIKENSNLIGQRGAFLDILDPKTKPHPPKKLLSILTFMLL